MAPFILLISLLLIFLNQPSGAKGGQVALRAQVRDQLLSRAVSSNTTLFDPTNEETFYVVGDESKSILRTIHRHENHTYVNFEKFEDLLLSQKRVCTPSPSPNVANTTVLSFPLSLEHYTAARRSWEGRDDLVFIGHDPSCFAADEERSSFKSLSIVFDDGLQTIRVTGKPLEYGDLDFPAPRELVIGKPPPSVVLTPRMVNGKRDTARKHKVKACLSHFIHCIKNFLDTDFSIPSSNMHFDFGASNEHQELRKKFWPSDATENTNLPYLFELYCVDCSTSGELELEVHIELLPYNEEDDDHHDDKGDDGHDLVRREKDLDMPDVPKEVHDWLGKKMRSHIGRVYVRYTVAEELKIRTQLEIVSTGAMDISCNIPLPPATRPPGAIGCTTKDAFTVGKLQYKPGDSKVDDKKLKKAQEDGKNFKGTKGFGFTLFPVDLGLYIYVDVGFSAEINVTLPGFEFSIPKGAAREITVLGDDTDHTDYFDPHIKVVPSDLHMKGEEVHLNLALSPKAAINIAIPDSRLGLGFSFRLDLIRWDNRFAEYENVTSSCAAPEVDDKGAFEKAVGYTLDLKTGLDAYFNFGGFYIGTAWIGKKKGSPFTGLYWGVKNVIAKCVDCGSKCFSGYLHDALELPADGVEAFLDWEGSWSNLTESKHSDGKESSKSIHSLDDQFTGDDMPTGDLKKACYAQLSEDQSLRRRHDDDDDVNCQPSQDGL